MKKETYERMSLVITEFDTEDVIATSGPGGGDNPGGNTPGTDTPPSFAPTGQWEMPVGL